MGSIRNKGKDNGFANRPFLKQTDPATTILPLLVIVGLFCGGPGRFRKSPCQYPEFSWG